VYFRDYPETKPGESVLTFLNSKGTLQVADSQSDPWLDRLAASYTLDRRSLPRRWTIKQAIDAFSNKFREGFDDPQFHKEERGYKWEAHELYVELLGQGQLSSLINDSAADEIVKRLQRIVQKVNLLSPQESMALHDSFRDAGAGLTLGRALDGVLKSGTPDQFTFERLIDAVNALPAKVGRARVASWPVLTVYPFLARPDTYMFLKPEVTKKAAENLAFNLNYDAKLNWLTYARLLEMSGLLMKELKPLGARDLIDVQSFIWVTGYLR
jgi:hypothetical protein